MSQVIKVGVSLRIRMGGITFEKKKRIAWTVEGGRGEKRMWIMRMKYSLQSPRKKEPMLLGEALLRWGLQWLNRQALTLCCMQQGRKLLAWQAGNCSVLKTGRTQRGRQILEPSPVSLNLSRESEDISECRKISDPEVESAVIRTWIGESREITLQG